ncbi:helix-turn-helix domain-containing protein [Mucilaginibacter sp. S1162]|uniref:Helix-turn-helix domain-containing protein n=1 Tax=Mucilaginibacter humi TaxID=2732510 RepID=A0ABX1W1S2_9SPHI|nr:helix-turn-helix domain-containing protein [Mucilaginibacter humi]NNU33543.1 helix-turn-helix domain-containing protein [Mucilaginibacter humi]
METKTIGSKIAKARQQINLSQAQLAVRLFISPQAVGKWERGESMPDIITLNRLAEITGVDLNYFSDNTRPATGDAAAGQPATPMPEKKLSWDMSNGKWVDADFSGLNNLHEKFSSSNMQRCKFAGSAMQGLLLKSNHVESCDFSASDLSNARIQGSHRKQPVYQLPA